jgi:hypothetical protein
MSEKIGSVKAELKSLDMYKAKYAEKPTTALERIIKKQQERVLKAVLQENEKKKTTKLMPAQMKEPEVIEMMPQMPPTIIEYKLTPSEMPAVEETVMMGEKVAKKKGDLPRLRKNVLIDIEKYRSTIGIPSRTLTRMKREAETGRESTVLKLAKELMDKYEGKYKEAMRKSKSKN